MKQKVNLLELYGHAVFVSYSNEDAFGRDLESRRGYKYTEHRAPTQMFMDWIKHVAGPRGTLWTATKADGGLNVYFYNRRHAVLAKLRWG